MTLQGQYAPRRASQQALYLHIVAVAVQRLAYGKGTGDAFFYVDGSVLGYIGGYSIR